MTTKLPWLRRGLSACLLASAVSTAVAESPTSIFSRAIGDGSATGVLSGKAADQWRAGSRSDEPIRVSAKVISRFKKVGCARLAIEMHQDGALKRDGTTGTAETSWELNLCVDGSPPPDERVHGALDTAMKQAREARAQK